MIVSRTCVLHSGCCRKTEMQYFTTEILQNMLQAQPIKDKFYASLYILLILLLSSLHEAFLPEKDQPG